MMQAESPITEKARRSVLPHPTWAVFTMCLVSTATQHVAPTGCECPPAPDAHIDARFRVAFEGWKRNSSRTFKMTMIVLRGAPAFTPARLAKRLGKIQKLNPSSRDAARISSAAPCSGQDRPAKRPSGDCRPADRSSDWRSVTGWC